LKNYSLHLELYTHANTFLAEKIIKII